MRASIQRLIRQNPFLLTLLLLVIAVLVNRILQENLLQLTVLNRNLRAMLPTMILVVGQTLVIISGGIDLSLGTMMLMINAIMVRWITGDSTNQEIILAMAASVGIGALAGAFNGFCIAVMRLQPIVTTYATGFIFAGIALEVLPRPGGNIPRDWSLFYNSPQQFLFLEWPFAAYMIVLLVLFWLTLRATRYGQYLFAVGGNAQAAYTTGVPVSAIRFTAYVWAGTFAGFAAIARTLLTGSANASLALRDGGTLTLLTITAVVLGGTRLSGGQGNAIGSIIGVALLTFIGNIISFANVPTWYQDLVNATIIVLALAGPGLLKVAQNGVSSLIVQRKKKGVA